MREIENCRMVNVTAQAVESLSRKLVQIEDHVGPGAVTDYQKGGKCIKLIYLLLNIYFWKVDHTKKRRCETSGGQVSWLGKRRNPRRLGQFRRHHLFFLLVLLATPASAVPVSGIECKMTNPSDSILDAGEVKKVTQQGHIMCDFSDKGYTSICNNAFHHAKCRHIDLSRNNLTNFSENLFNGVSVMEINLTGNQFHTAPVIKNSEVEVIILDQNPLTSIPDNYTRDLPKLRVLSFNNCPNLANISVTAFNCGCVEVPLRIDFYETAIDNLNSCCSEHVNVTANQDDDPPSVTVTCNSNGSHVTLEYVSAALLNGTASESSPTTIKTISDPGTPPATPPSETTTPETSMPEMSTPEISTPETQTNFQYPLKVVFAMCFSIPVAIYVSIGAICLILFCICRRSCNKPLDQRCATFFPKLSKGCCCNLESTRGEQKGECEMSQPSAPAKTQTN